MSLSSVPELLPPSSVLESPLFSSVLELLVSLICTGALASYIGPGAEEPSCFSSVPDRSPLTSCLHRNSRISHFCWSPYFFYLIEVRSCLVCGNSYFSHLCWSTCFSHLYRNSRLSRLCRGPSVDVES